MKLQLKVILALQAMNLAAMAEEQPKTAAEFLGRGMQRFSENRIAESLEDFNQVAQLRPEVAPQLWQRGISHYYAGKFIEGRRQFESHKEVNPHDVENATWHFLCVAQINGVEQARKELIAIETDRDTRVPMAEIFQFYSGEGSSEAILQAAEKEGTERARMYAHLYLGLYYEVTRDVEKARMHIRQSAAAKLQNNYMHQVAKIHLLQRKWNRQVPEH